MARSSAAESGSPSLADLFNAQRDDEADDPIIAGLPPSSAPLVRSPRSLPIADLTQLSKLFVMIGPGGSGKTVLARWLCGEMIAHDVFGRAMVAAADPTNRTLVDFIKGVQQPPSANPAETTIWLRSLLAFIGRQRADGVIDLGGGDTAFSRIVERAPDLPNTLEEQGVGMIAAYTLTPRVDDVASLVTFEQGSFNPRATALILNLAKADSPAAFDVIRRQRAFKAALARGAVEIWLPALPQEVALRIEQARVSFRQAQDGEAPAGRKPANLSMIERVMVREWLERMTDEFAPVASWLPWM